MHSFRATKHPYFFFFLNVAKILNGWKRNNNWDFLCWCKKSGFPFTYRWQIELRMKWHAQWRNSRFSLNGKPLGWTNYIVSHNKAAAHEFCVRYQSTPGQRSAEDVTASHWLTVTGFWSDHTWQSVCFYLLSFTISFLLYTIALFPFFPFLLSRWYATHGHLPTISRLISAVATHFSVLDMERPSAHRDRPRLYTWLWWPMWLELPMRQG